MGLRRLVKPLIRQRVVSQSHTRHLLPVSLLAFGSSSLLPSLLDGPSLLISIWMSQPEGPAVLETSKQLWAGRALLSYQGSSGEKERERASPGTSQSWAPLQAHPPPTPSLVLPRRRLCAACNSPSLGQLLFLVIESHHGSLPPVCNHWFLPEGWHIGQHLCYFGGHLW